MITAGTVSIGSASSIPVVSSPMLPRDAATAPFCWPACTSIEACTTLPAADPPGSTRLAALPASCELAASDQRVVGRVIRTSTHSAAMLPVSSSTRTDEPDRPHVSSSGHWSRRADDAGYDDVQPDAGHDQADDPPAPSTDDAVHALILGARERACVTRWG